MRTRLDARWRRAARLGVVAAGCALVAAGAHATRRRLVAALFVDGPEGGAPPNLPKPRVEDRLGPSPRSLDPAPRVRVVLIDGLRADVARTLPRLSALCAGGLDLAMDAGFPTVSLPIERAIWTGETQRQSGIEFRASDLPEPPPDAIPLKVESRAVAESHGFIVRSLGFGDALPRKHLDVIGPNPTPLTEHEWMGWGVPLFEQAAIALAASDAPRLGFAHILRVDDAGHAHGSRSPEYAAAARSADALLGRLLDAERTAHPPARPGGIGDGTRWFVLSDHGHLPKGGHGDAEPEVRITRLCVAGALPPQLLELGRAHSGAVLHAVDVARAIGDSLGVPLGWEARGRPLGVAIEDARPGATLPRPSLPRTLLALLLVVLGGAAAGAGQRALVGTLAQRSRLLLVGAAPLALAALVAGYGAPSLSRTMVYRTWPTTMWTAFGPAMLLLLVASLRVLVRRAVVAAPAGDGSARPPSPLAVAAAGLALPLCASLATLALAGAEVLVGLSSTPPFAPFWTGRALALLGVLAMAAAALAAAALAGAVRAACDRSAPAETARRAA